MVTNRYLQDRQFSGQVQVLLQMLDDLPSYARTPTALAVTASLLEYAAYEVAQSEEAKAVARMIVLAADMERASAELRARTDGP